MNEPAVINQGSVDRALHYSTWSMRVLAVVELIAFFIAIRMNSAPVGRTAVLILAAGFCLLPAIVCFALAEGLKRQRYWSLVSALTVVTSVLLLGLVLATFIGAYIVADSLPQVAYRFVVLIGVLALPQGWTLYTLMKSYDAMRPDDWNQ